MKRKFINQIVLTAAFALAPLFAQAYVFEADGIYYNITSLSDLTVEVTYETTSYNSYSGKITIPDTVTYNGKTYAVTTIGIHAFRNCTSLTSVTIGGAVTTIGSSAFYNCTSLTSVTIPDAVTYIGSSAFYNCSKLTSVTIPDAVTYIGSSAFYNCSKLTSVTIPDAVTSIGSYAFYKCTSLTSITIPDAVTSIGEYAFSSCTSLKSVTIPDAMTSIGSHAFYGCSSLTSITIPDAVTSIGSSAFYGCTSLTSITIPDAVTSIGSSVFCECTSLKSVTIGEAVTSIGSSAFYGCTSLNEIYCSRIEPPTCVSSYCFSNYDATLYVPDDAVETYATTEVWGYFTTILGFSEVPIFEVDGISYTVTSKEDLEVEVSAGDYSGEITIPETVTYGGKTYAVTSIGNSAFSGCTRLTSVTIGGAVTTIGIYAFRNCTSLTSVTIGDAVTTIGSYAFYKCTSLDEIYSLNTTPPTCVSSYCFSNYAATLHVPTEAVDTYSSTYVWKKFTTIVGDIDSAVESVSVDETEAQPTGYYSLSGQRLNGPSESGATIIRYSDGTTKKVFVR